MIIQELADCKLIQPPKWLIDNCSYLTIMGSVAYGVAGSASDLDIYGFCVPPREMTFPHLAGEIPGFGHQIQRFEQWSKAHIQHPDKAVEYDFSLYSIVKYFHLLMENNPNIIDSIFVPRRCVIHMTPMAEHVRENRKVFLHRGAMHKFRGYLFSQRNKIRNKVNSNNPKRAADIKKYGFDVKFSYHVVRLGLECEQILVEGDLDLERNSDILKSIRRGEWTLDQIEAWTDAKLISLETSYATSPLPHSPDESRIKEILLNCLEMAYGSLDTIIARNPSMDSLLIDLKEVLARYSK